MTRTVASLQEAHLIVTLLGIVLPAVSEDDLVSVPSPSGCLQLVLR